MVKTGVGPIGWIVATPTVVAAAAIVRVVFCVTVETGVLWFGEGSVCMAVETLHLQVLADEWIISRVMIIFGVKPLCWLVAFSTVGTHRVLVRCVFTMTVDAVGRRLSILQFG